MTNVNILKTPTDKTKYWKREMNKTLERFKDGEINSEECRIEQDKVRLKCGLMM